MGTICGLDDDAGEVGAGASAVVAVDAAETGVVSAEGCGGRPAFAAEVPGNAADGMASTEAEGMGVSGADVAALGNDDAESSLGAASGSEVGDGSEI